MVEYVCIGLYGRAYYDLGLVWTARKFPSPVEIVASSCSPGAGLPSREGNQASAIRI